MGRVALALAGMILFAGNCGAQGPEASPPARDLDALTIEELMQVKVQGAALHPQTIQDAPASVSIITADDIAKYGYQTLGEALASVRGFYLGNNRTYETVGVRGFNAPGDYDSHILVMVNGHNMADNIFNFMLFFGNDFPIDMNLIKQIEIIRGPSSALYGTNGMFATVNIVTKTPQEAGPAAVSATFDSSGERMGQIATAVPLGGEAKLLVAGTAYNTAGDSPIYFPEFNTAQTNFGQAIRMNGEKGFHAFANFAWRNWTVIAVFGGHNKLQPVSWGPTIFNNRGTQNSEMRDFVDARYTRAWGAGTLTWRTYYDEQRYSGRFMYPLDAGNPSEGGVEDNRQVANGKWVGSEVTYRLDTGFAGTVTAGVDAKFDLRARQTDYDVWPVPMTFLDVEKLDQNTAVFVQDERKFSRHWTLDLGARYDHSRNLHDFFSPRAALLFQPTSEWTYKFLYGRSFRNPSAFQLYNGDGLSSIANPQARPERTETFETDAERKLGRRMNLLVAAYAYQLHDFLEGVRVGDAGLIQYQNSGRIHARGVEIEINGRPRPWLEGSISYSFQRTVDDIEHDTMEFSPEHLVKARFAVPAGRKFAWSSGVQYESSSLSLGGGTTGAGVVVDMTLATRHLWSNFDFAAGLRNTFNDHYSIPIALNPLVDTMQQPGRSVFVALIAHERGR